MMNKKAQGEFYFESWAELFFFVLLVIGVIFAIIMHFSAILSYILIFICGLMGGRMIYERKKKLQFPYYLIIAGFLVGYIIGAYYGNKILMIALFIIGGIISYLIHDRGIIHDTPF